MAPLSVDIAAPVNDVPPGPRLDARGLHLRSRAFANCSAPMTVPVTRWVYQGSSHGQVTLTVRWEKDRSIESPVVHPGAHTVSADAPDQDGPEPKLNVSGSDSEVEVLDADTYQLLTVITRPVQQHTLAPLGTDGDRVIAWSIDVPAFSS